MRAFVAQPCSWQEELEEAIWRELGRPPPQLPTGFFSCRLFSLQVPVPPKIFLSLVYKFEGTTNVRVALELTTEDASSCHIGSISVLNGEELGASWFFVPEELPKRRLDAMAVGRSAAPAFAEVGAGCAQGLGREDLLLSQPWGYGRCRPPIGYGIEGAGKLNVEMAR